MATLPFSTYAFYRLGNDINVSSQIPFEPIGQCDFESTQPVVFGGLPFVTSGFTGDFDGAGFIVRGIRVEDAYTNMGMFGCAIDGTIHDLQIEDIIVDAGLECGGIHPIGTIDVGALVGAADHVELEGIFIRDAEVKGCASVGALAGFAEGSLITRSSTDGSVSGWQHVGGLVGTAMADEIADVKVDGSIDGSLEAGGIVGWAAIRALTNQSVPYSYTHVCRSLMDAGVSAQTRGGLIGFNSTMLVQTGAFWLTRPAGYFGPASTVGHSCYPDPGTADSFLPDAYTWDVGNSSAWGPYTCEDAYPGQCPGAQRLSSRQLQDQQIYLDANWNFEKVWQMSAVDSKPELQVAF